MLTLKSALIAAAAAGALAVAGAASATTTVTIDNVTAAWTGHTSGSSVSATILNGGKTARLRWGTRPQGTSQSDFKKSGYDFKVNAANEPWNVDVDAPGDSGFFTIGTFTHLNNVIASGSSITGAQLTLNANITVGTETVNRSFVFDFTHEETPNEDRAKDCLYGGNTSINNPPCADRVTVNFNSSSDSFIVDGVRYTVDIAGFSSESGMNPVTEFLSREGGNNSAYVKARVTTEVLSTPTPGVPEPATWAMLITGFGLVGLGARQRSRKLHLTAA